MGNDVKKIGMKRYAPTTIGGGKGYPRFIGMTETEGGKYFAIEDAQELLIACRAVVEAYLDVIEDYQVNCNGAGLMDGLNKQEDALNALLAHIDDAQQQTEPIAPTHSEDGRGGEYGDAYQGAREDLAIWKRRALEAEEDVRRKDRIIDHLTLEAQGETRMGEPFIAQPARQVGDEREAFIAWAVGTYPDAYTEETAAHYWQHDHISALAWQARAALAPATAVDIDAMVSRFLGWKLPENFYPDCGISFDGRKDDEWNKNKSWPVGTNLFSGEQAKAMFEYALDGAALAPAAVVCVMPEPYGWIAAGEFFKWRQYAIDAAENTPCIEVYSRPQMLSLNRRAIPAGLLERACKDYTGRENLDALEPDRLAAAAELRALLGKEGEK